MSFRADAAVNVTSSALIVSCDWARNPPVTGRYCQSNADSIPAVDGTGSEKTRVWRRSRILSASSVYPGATSTQYRTPLIARAMSPSTILLHATTPPNADSGSPAYARRYASAGEEPTPTPHGLLCLTMLTATPVKSATIA